ncbi:MAG: FAD-dependent monooxygenase [Flavobacteriales bacterium]|nr:FAD-dependent monooxygenase [Flavobacteriales bacterium]MCX7649159.1 FAD-dependent monooxygenase [Flavobacteriales bacterium]MDW8432458.1 NAD(P)/FAD-dependent oxidoreductase [Flavobacteriales bacterium]
MQKITAEVLIAGGGLVGSLLALMLRRRGLDVVVVERRPDMRTTAIPAGRSINLALSDRGIRALKAAGAFDAIAPLLLPMHRRTMHAVDGTLTYQPYGRPDQWINSVGRGALNKILLDLSEKAGVRYYFEQRAVQVDPDSHTLRTDQGLTFQYKKLLACDGAFSAVRLHAITTDRFNYSQTYLEHGYCEIAMKPGHDGRWQWPHDTLHIWPRKSFMLIALPNPDGSFTCTLFLPFEGPLSFAEISTPEQAARFVETWFPDITARIPDYPEQFSSNTRSSLMTVRCAPWNLGEDILLLGDAAHAIVPFYGQGMNAGFEDVRLLCEWADARGGVLAPGLFPAFARFRQPDGFAIADLALKNFIEMRDLTADPAFLLRKKIEAWFAEKHPDLWIPQYTLVTFSHVPYHLALEIGRLQDEVMDQVLKEAADVEKGTWNHALASDLMRQAAQRFPPLSEN